MVVVVVVVPPELMLEVELEDPNFKAEVDPEATRFIALFKFTVDDALVSREAKLNSLELILSSEVIVLEVEVTADPVVP